MSSLSEEQLNRISRIVHDVEKLSDIEKLLLYLQLPCGRAEVPEGSKYKTNHSNGSNSNNSSNKCGDLFAKKPDQETTQTYTWILSHLEEDPNVSLPKQEVYDEYRAFCQANRFEPLCVADFGKAMKHAFPCIKPRRLGQRGNSRYCYSGLRKRYRIESPSVPSIINCRIADEPANVEQQQQSAALVDQLHLATGAAASQQQQPPGQNCCSSSLGSHQTLNLAAATQRVKHEQQQFDHSNDHSGHQRRRPYEAINLKLEPVQHEQQQQQQQGHSMGAQQARTSIADQSSDYSSGGSSSETITHNQMAPAHQHRHNNDQHHNQHDMMPVQQQQQLGNQHSPTGPLLAPQHNHHHHQQQQQQHEEPGQQSYHQLTVQPQQRLQMAPQQRQQPPAQSNGPQANHQYHLLQRLGTPDDDDYRHNYQDLNRPIVGAAMAFSHSMPAQMACVPQARVPAGAPYCDYHLVGPSCCNPGGGATAAAAAAEPSEPPTPAAQFGPHHHQQQQQRQHYADECGDSAAAIGGELSHIVRPLLVQQQQHHRQMQHQLHVNTDDTHLCASPFQSPASTPYPMIGSAGSSSNGASGGGGTGANQTLGASTYLAGASSSTTAAAAGAPQTEYYSSQPSPSLLAGTRGQALAGGTSSAAGDCLQYADA